MLFYSFIKSEDHRVIKLEMIGGFVMDGHYFDFEYPRDKHMYTIWGLTARILLLAACVAYNRLPQFYDKLIPGSTELEKLFMGYLPNTLVSSKL